MTDQSKEKEVFLRRRRLIASMPKVHDLLRRRRPLVPCSFHNAPSQLCISCYFPKM